jgi:hypothetical protein
MTLTNPVNLLKAASVVVIAFGVLIALAAWPATAGITVFFADLLFWPLDGAQNLDQPVARLLAGISGGLLVGWGVMLWQIATRVWRRDRELASSLIRTSLLAWFAVDSAASTIAGAPLNVLFNAAFLGAFLLPLRMAEGDRGQA